MTDADALPPETAVGRVALRVADLDRLVPFYRDVIGCHVERDDRLVRLAAPDGVELLRLEESPEAPPRPAGAAGLFHAAIRVPDRAALGAALERIRAADVRLDGASDHLVSEALYLRDPAGNGLELYRDRPRSAWDRQADGRVVMDTLAADLEGIAEAASPAGRLPAGTDLGHVHLEVTDLADSTACYVEGLGLRPSASDYAGASFLAAGDYHHHLACNVWNRRGEPAGDHRGLRWFELVIPDAGARSAAVDRLRQQGRDVESADGTAVLTDPDGVECRLAVPD